MVKYIIPVILIAMAVTGFTVFTNPLYQEVSGLRGEVAAYDEALDNSKQLENERDKLTQKYNELNPSNLEKLEKLLPDSVDNIRLILEIEKIALPYGMALQDVKYEAKPAEEDPAAGQGSEMVSSKEYGMWELSFSTQGTYANFVKFLGDLEKNLRIVDVASVQFSSDMGEAVAGFSQVYRYTVQIRTYWLKN